LVKITQFFRIFDKNTKINNVPAGGATMVPKPARAVRVTEKRPCSPPEKPIFGFESLERFHKYCSHAAVKRWKNGGAVFLGLGFVFGSVTGH
jgi:hypothetical protein